MALRAYAEKRFGRKTRAIVNPLDIEEVSTGVTQVLNNNPDRLMFLIINLSDTNMYFGWFRDVNATKGMILAAAGGTIIMAVEDDAELVGYEFFVQCAADNKAIFIMVVEAE